jgi:hypothetical protein
MQLREIYELMHWEADKYGESTSRLKGGVKMKLVKHGSGSYTIAVWRRHKKLGETEIITFHRHFAIPAGAKRIPATGQAERFGMDDGPVSTEAHWFGVAWKVERN